MENTTEKYTIYCIPGLGVNEQLFNNLRLTYKNGDAIHLKFIHWESPLKRESLPEYAMRLAQQIDQSRPFVLIGVSFGGMCAIEISKQLNPLKTIVISSSKTTQELPFSLKLLSPFPLHHLFNDTTYVKGALVLGKRFGVHKKIANVFKESLKPPPGFFARAVHMIVHWKNKTIPENVIHIHGRTDKILPYLKKVKYDHTIEQGSHSMIWDRAEEINKIINSELRKIN